MRNWNHPQELVNQVTVNLSSPEQLFIFRSKSVRESLRRWGFDFFISEDPDYVTITSVPSAMKEASHDYKIDLCRDVFKEMIQLSTDVGSVPLIPESIQVY